MAWRLRGSFTQQRNKINKLSYKATRSHFRDIKFNRLKKIIPRKPKYGLFQGTDTFSWLLETTGPSQLATQQVNATNDGHIYSIKIDFPSGSEYQFHIRVSIDEAIIFPSKLSQELRGDHKLKEYEVHKPFQRGSKIMVEMISDATLAANTDKACWVDISIKYEKRVS